MAAIYMWFPGQALVATSTLYPIETDNGLQFSGTVIGGALRDWFTDDLTAGMTFLSATLEEVVLFGPTLEDELTAGLTFLSATLEEVVIFGPTPEDELTAGLTFLEATLTPKLVAADSQDTGIHFSATIVSGSMQTE